MKNISIILVVILLIGFGIYALNQNSDSDENLNNEINSQDSSNNVISDLDPLENPENTDLAVGSYEVYSPEKVQENSDKNVVLFFKADWCPSCRALDGDIKNNLKEIPEDLVILELNYDKETELKKKYGVTTQHTLVLVDSEGNMIDKWSGGNRLVSVVEKINQ